MTQTAAKAFAAALERLRECKAQMSAVAAAEELPEDNMKDDYLESESKHFASLLVRLFRTIVMIHEALDQRQSLEIFISGFEKLRPTLSTVSFFDGDASMPESAVLDYLAEELTIVGSLLTVQKSATAQWKILWTMLEQTNILIGQQSKQPKREKDVQDVLEKALIIPFPDTIREPSIPKQTKTYRPDFGIQSLRTAIEVKFVAKKGDVGKALGELYEDMHGYAGSPEWSMFMAVIYMTGPFVSKQRVEAEARKAKLPKNWQVCVSVGSGGKSA